MLNRQDGEKGRMQKHRSAKKRFAGDSVQIYFEEIGTIPLFSRSDNSVAPRRSNDGPPVNQEVTTMGT